MSKRSHLRRCLIGLWLLAAPLALAQDDDVVDFSDLVTPTCEVIGLVGLPPEGWFNVPIQSERDDLKGCQMMRAGESDELLGVLRMLSRAVPAETPEDEWMPELFGLEMAWLEQMGITVGEPLWKKEEVTMTGTDWGPGRAIGLEATIEGNDVPQEVHLLAFGSPTTKYLITLSTPAESVDDGVHYRRNTADMGVLMRTLQFPD